MVQVEPEVVPQAEMVQVEVLLIVLKVEMVQVEVLLIVPKVEMILIVQVEMVQGLMTNKSTSFNQ